MNMTELEKIIVTKSSDGDFRFRFISSFCNWIGAGDPTSRPDLFWRALNSSVQSKMSTGQSYRKADEATGRDSTTNKDVRFEACHFWSELGLRRE